MGTCPSNMKTKDQSNIGDQVTYQQLSKDTVMEKPAGTPTTENDTGKRLIREYFFVMVFWAQNHKSKYYLTFFFVSFTNTFFFFQSWYCPYRASRDGTEFDPEYEWPWLCGECILCIFIMIEFFFIRLYVLNKYGALLFSVVPCCQFPVSFVIC